MKFLKEIIASQDISNYFVQDPLLFYNLKKTIVNLDKNKNQAPFRAYKDESTSSFVSTFFKNEDTLNYFLYYNFQIIHYYLITNMNSELQKHDEILKSDEELFLVFKGGNVIHFYFNKIIDLIKGTAQEKNNNDEQLLSEISELNKNFKTSDVDMSVYILNNNEMKFNLIYYYVNIYLTKALVSIRNSFESILKKTINVKESDLEQLPMEYFYNQDPNVDIYSIHNDYVKLASLFEKVSDNTSTDAFISKLSELLRKFMNQENQIYIFTDIYVGSRYISILQMINYYYNKFSKVKQLIDTDNLISRFVKIISNTIQVQNKTILNQLNNKLYKLSGFYTELDITNMINGIIEKFNSPDYQNKSFFNRDENPSVEYSITKPVSTENIFINAKKDFVFRNINSPEFYGMITFTDENVHFISVNNAISNPIGSEHIVTFDLYRIKFNIKFQGITNVSAGKSDTLNIPSEFIDVSIPKFYDFNLSQLRHKAYNNSGYTNYFSKLNNPRLNCLNVLSTNLKYTIKDLNGTLYEQSTFIPWNDNKYNKRIIRLLFIIFVSYYRKANTLKCLDRFNSVFGTFIDNLQELSDNIVKWYSDKNESNKNDILNSISKIIYFNDQTNNLLNVNTLRNFYNYQDKLFFKIRYYNISDPNNLPLEEIIHDELDLSINIIAKIAFFLVSDEKIYREYLNENLNEYNYVFNSDADKKNYIDKVFIEEYIEFVKKFITNVKFMKKIIFENAPNYQNFPVEDLFIGGGSKSSYKKIINYDSKSVSFGSLIMSDIKFKSKSNKNKYNYIDFESSEMV
jgi:hypothetical protein